MIRNFQQPGRSIAATKNGMAATSHSVATLTAVQILERGGNAIDAAVAAVAVQSVVEAGSTGIGGDCFALLSKGGATDVIGYNGSGKSPAAATYDVYAQRGVQSIERHTPDAVTIPGAVEAWARLIKDHGRLELGELLLPAVKLAREGYAITPRVAFEININAKPLMIHDAARRLFLTNDAAPAVGSIQVQPRLADTLEAIGNHGPDAFYRGAVAQDMVECLSSLGGLHTLEDFAATRGEYVTPITTQYRGRTVYECPPNGQGIIALLILNILSRFEIRGGPLDIENIHRELEATRLAYAARQELLADNAPVDYLLSDALADRLAGMIDPEKASETLPRFDVAEHKDTVTISVVDKDRNAVTLINSLFASYGSCIVSPRAGVLFQNRGQGFSLQKGHPNAIGPSKRPMHTIIPGMVSEGGRVVLAFGVMGGHYQGMGHAHFLSKLFDHGMDLQSAMDVPRLFPQPGTRKVECEQPLLALLGPELTRRGFEVAAAQRPIGGAQAVWIDWKNGSLLGGSDFRKDGAALGY
jgi:gamma-glutamyltranspeptidase/glutathione hydrolase